MDTTKGSSGTSKTLRKLQAFDNVIYLIDYLWVVRKRNKDQRPHYGHALEVFYWQKEMLNDEEKKRTFSKVAEIFEKAPS